MALTVADVDAGQGIPITGGTSGYREVFKDVTFDASYATGGLSLTAAMLGLTSVVQCSAQSASGYVFSYDFTNSKLLAYRDAGSAAVMAEVPNTTDLHTVTTRLRAVGTSSV